MVISMRSTKVKNFFKKEPNLSFDAAKIQQNCTGTGNYNSKQPGKELSVWTINLSVELAEK